MKLSKIPELVPSRFTVDIEVENTHSYQLSNGVVVHNTVSQLVDASSGMHPRHSKYYIRRYRISASDPLFKMMKAQGVPYSPENGQTEDNATTFVFSFPIKSPDSTTVFKNDLTAKQQLTRWLEVKTNYTEHNPSVTISIDNDEWVSSANWVLKNWDMVGGLSFLPKDDFMYQQAPYEEITEKKYNEMLKSFADIDYSQILLYEKEDATEGAKTLACSNGVCEL